MYSEKVKIELVYQFAGNSGSSVPEQSVSMDLSKYSFIILQVFAYYGSAGSSTMLIPIGHACSFWFQYNLSNTTPSTYCHGFRSFRSHADRLEMSNGQQLSMFTSSTPVSGNQYVVPSRVWGVLPK